MDSSEMATHILYIRGAVDELKETTKDTAVKVQDHEVRLVKAEAGGARNTRIGAIGGLIGGFVSGLLSGKVTGS